MEGIFMWTYKGEVFTEEMIGENYGFVYVITHVPSGKKYIGRKFFSMAGYKTVKGKRKKIRKPSDWKNYYGSSPVLAKAISEYGVEQFTREIVMLCPNRSSASYYESKLIFETDAILSDNYWNEHVQCRISGYHVLSKPKRKNIQNY